MLPEFHENRDIQWTMFVDESESSSSIYDMIIVRDLLLELGIEFYFTNKTMTWDNASVLMKNQDYFYKENILKFQQEKKFMHNSDTTEVKRIQQTLGVKYAPANLEDEVEKSDQLTESQKS